jgi:hypothetical protein
MWRLLISTLTKTFKSTLDQKYTQIKFRCKANRFFHEKKARTKASYPFYVNATSIEHTTFTFI